MALLDIVIDESYFEVGTLSSLTGGAMLDVCFGNVIDATTALVGGSVQGVSYDGNAYAFSTTGATPVLPAVGDVDFGVGYGIGGTEFTGTLVQPAVTDVKLAVQYGAGGTEFTGDRKSVV